MRHLSLPAMLVLTACVQTEGDRPARALPAGVVVDGQLPADADLDAALELLPPGRFGVIADPGTGEVATITRSSSPLARLASDQFSVAVAASCPDCVDPTCEFPTRTIAITLSQDGVTDGAPYTVRPAASVNFSAPVTTPSDWIGATGVDVALSTSGTLPACASFSYYFDVYNDGPATVALDDGTLAVEMTYPTPIDPNATLDFPQAVIDAGTLTLSLTGPGSLTVPATPAIGAITGNGTALVQVDLAGADVADVEAVLRGTTLTSPSQGTGTIAVVLDTPAFAGIGDTRAFDVGPLDLFVGPGGDHTTISAAITQVRTTTGATGSTIRVAAGDYQAEGELWIANDPDLVGLTLLGAAAGKSAGVNPTPGREAAITQVSQVEVDAASVTIDGIDALGATTGDGFDLGGAGATLRNCVSSGSTNSSSVSVRSVATNTTIQNCAFSGYLFGVFIQGSTGLEISGNTFRDHSFEAIAFTIATPTGTEVVTGNAFANNGRHIATSSSAPNNTLDAAGNSFEGTGVVRILGGVDADVTGSWWGQAAGPLAGQLSVGASAVLDTSGHLTVDPFPAFP